MATMIEYRAPWTGAQQPQGLSPLLGGQMKLASWLSVRAAALLPLYQLTTARCSQVFVLGLLVRIDVIRVRGRDYRSMLHCVVRHHA